MIQMEAFKLTSRSVGMREIDRWQRAKIKFAIENMFAKNI